MPEPLPKSDYFEILDLEPGDVGIQDIRIAYKTLALKWHPDRHATDKEEAQHKFVEISEAYRALLEEYEHKKRGRSQSKPSHTASASSASSSSSRSSTDTSSRSENQTKDRPEEEVGASASPHNSPRSSPRSKLHPASPRREHSDLSSNADAPSGHNHDISTKPPVDSRSSIPSSPRKHAKDTPSPPSPVQASHNRPQVPPRKRHNQQWSDDSDRSHKTSAPAHKKSKNDYDSIDLGTPIPPLRSRKQTGHLRDDWVFPLRVTLEDLYYGTAHHYRITRTLHTGQTEAVKIDIHVSSGWCSGTEIRVPAAGNERKDGSFQDIVFIIEEEPHPRFTRINDDLLVSVQVPWADAHPPSYVYPPRAGSEKWAREDEVYVRGLDGEEFALSIPRTLVEGADGTRVVGAGMPARKGGRIVGKGDLIVRWEFVFPEAERAQRSRWQTLKKAMYWRP